MPEKNLESAGDADSAAFARPGIGMTI